MVHDLRMEQKLHDDAGDGVIILQLITHAHKRVGEVILTIAEDGIVRIDDDIFSPKGEKIDNLDPEIVAIVGQRAALAHVWASKNVTDRAVGYVRLAGNGQVVSIPLAGRSSGF